MNDSRKRSCRSRRRDSGQTLVEFAIAATVFFALVAALTDIGRAVWYQSTLQNAVQEAARYAAVHGSASTSPIGPTDGSYSAGPPPSDSSITTFVTRYTPGLHTSNVTVTSSWPDGDNAPGHRVTISATYPFNALTNFFGIFSLTLTASSTRIIIH
jgi:Flp pilus assembly protein TadG